MNERIKELIEQCESTSRFSYEGRGGHDMYYFNKEKFAELLIKDCIDVADRHNNGSSDEWDKCARSISRDITHIFGVE